MQLPIDAVLDPLRHSLRQHQEAVLEAPPGAGKTTKVPLALLHEPWLAGQSILMLEPRRLAAKAAAERLAQQLGEPVGKTVGYRIRLDSRVSAQTRIEVVTEGILTRRLQEDPALEGVGLVIFDEFHERSLEADLALALTLNARALLRETPLRILLMSATLDGERLSTLLNQAPIIRSEGRLHPVDIRWGSASRAGEAIDQPLLAQVVQAFNNETGSILVFLPGQAEIRRLHQALTEALEASPNLLICPLHGELELSVQRAAIDPAPAGVRKIVLATNIAETSLTIEGVRVVVDSGLARVPRFDPKTGMTRLETRRISQASATQRAGRAGRLESGICYRLWSEEQHQQLAAHTEAEILQADLSGLMVQLARWGAEPSELVWLDAPPAAACAQAIDLLTQLGAWHQGRLTTQGQRMAELPAHPRLAHMLLRGQALGLGKLAAELAALLVERDPSARDEGADLSRGLALLQVGRGSGLIQRIRQLAQQFNALLSGPVSTPLEASQQEHGLGLLLAFAYPDRIAKQRQSGGVDYQLANGRAARLNDADPLRAYPWLVIAELSSQQGQREERIHRAAPLDPEFFSHQLAEQVQILDYLDWDEREGAFRAERQWRIGSLIWRTEPLNSLSEEARSQALVALVRRKGLELLPWTPELRQWQARIALLRQLDLEHQEHSPWPDLCNSVLLNSLEDWLLPHLGNVTRLAHFARLDLAAILTGLLAWPLPKQLDELAPERLNVPSGSQIRLDYTERPPILAVRLQELFGLAETPRIAGGRQIIKLHLLSPAHRPVQVTQDLASFWRTTYAEVKKDLKGRYPKHYWPDDPLIAAPTARAKPRGQ